MLAREALTESARRSASSDFQVLVGGLGFGPTTELDACPFDYDPRLDCPCATDFGPLPAGTQVDPQGAGHDPLPQKE